MIRSVFKAGCLVWVIGCPLIIIVAATASHGSGNSGALAGILVFGFLVVCIVSIVLGKNRGIARARNMKSPQCTSAELPAVAVMPGRAGAKTRFAFSSKDYAEKFAAANGGQIVHG